jgi:predicted DCC family thiol-disulfide oxidoreductase YuxK
LGQQEQKEVSKIKKTKIYYDNECYVCSFEINAIRKRGEKCGIEFIDISDPDFISNGESYETEMIGEFEGEKTVGAETFRRMYHELGFRKTVALSRLPLVKQILDIGYYIFAYTIRPNLPKRRKK